MPKIQTYVNNRVFDGINNIMTERQIEGMPDVSISSVSLMLLELGLRVYELQKEKKESGFNQREFDKTVLEMTSKSNALNSHILKLLCALAEKTEIQHESYSDILEKVRAYSQQKMDSLFSEVSDENNKPID